MAGRLRDTVVHFNPFFATGHRTDPGHVLAIDVLHTVYYGPMMMLIVAILWRVLLSNPWGMAGTAEHILEQGARRLEAHMLLWFSRNRVPQRERIATLNLSMLGDRHDCGINDGNPRPGCPLKLKAAETGNILPWSLAILQERGERGP